MAVHRMTRIDARTLYVDRIVGIHDRYWWVMQRRVDRATPGQRGRLIIGAIMGAPNRRLLNATFTAACQAVA
jgi:hypothetical protein